MLRADGVVTRTYLSTSLLSYLHVSRVPFPREQKPANGHELRIINAVIREKSNPATMQAGREPFRDVGDKSLTLELRRPRHRACTV